MPKFPVTITEPGEYEIEVTLRKVDAAPPPPPPDDPSEPPPPTTGIPGNPVAAWILDGTDTPATKLANRVRPSGALSLTPMIGPGPGVELIDATGAKVSGKPDSEVADRWFQATEGAAPDEIPYFDGWLLWEFVRDLDSIAPFDRYEGALTHPAADLSMVWNDLTSAYHPYLHFSRHGTGTSEEFGRLTGSKPLPPVGEVWRVLMTWHCRREGEARESELRLYYDGETTPEVVTLPRVFAETTRPHQLNIGNEPEFQHGGESVCASGRVRKVMVGSHELTSAEVGQLWAWLSGAVPPPPPDPEPDPDPDPLPPPPSDEDFIDTGHDQIPNWAKRPTLIAKRSGLFTDPAVWGGRVPTANDRIVFDVPVMLDGSDMQCHSWSSLPSGALLNVAGATAKLTFRNGLVLEGGKLEAIMAGGGSLSLVTADQPLDLTTDPEQYGAGLIALGKVLLQGAPKTPFVRLAEPAAVGATVLKFAAPVSGWFSGDLLCVAGGPRNFTLPTEGAESVKILSVASDGKSATLQAPLRFAHDADEDGNLPHVGNLTRNVTIRSERASGVRGHVMLTHHAEASFTNVAFAGMGRTTYEPLGPGNQVGRYGGPHFHHVDRPFRMEGCSAFCPMPAHPYKWGTVLHDAKGGTVRNNVLYNWAGSGLYVEDLDATSNTIEDNFVCLTRGRPGCDRFDWGMKGEGIAMRSADNIVRRNVVANCDDRAYSLYATGPAREFADNECYHSASDMATWNMNGSGTTQPNPSAPQSTIKNLSGWNLQNHGVGLGYESLNVTWDGLKLRGTGVPNSYGFQYGDYDTLNFVIRNADMRGMRNGIEPPLKVHDRSIYKPGEFLLENSYLDNDINIYVKTPSGPGAGGAASCRPRKVVIRNVRHGASSRLKIAMQCDIFSQANLLVRDQIFVYAHDGDPTLNFRVYYREQVPGFKMPRGVDFDGYGAPVANFTNAQLAQRYRWRLSLEPFDLQFWESGRPEPTSVRWVSWDPASNPSGWEPVCVAGEIAPADAVDGSPWGIDGLVKRF